RARALQELDKRVDDGLPQAVQDFLRQPWLHHVTMSILRDGDEGTAMAESLALADGVFEEVAEARRHTDGKPWLQAWEPGLQKVFASVGLHGDAALVAIGALHDTLQAVAEARPELEKSLPELPQVSLPQPPTTESAAVELGADPAVEDFDNADAD